MVTAYLTSLFHLKWVRKHKWVLLLFGIFALLIISPIDEIFDNEDNIITPLTALVVLAVTLGTTEKHLTIGIVISLTLVWMITGIVTDGSGLLAGEKTGDSVAAPVLFLFVLLSVFVLLARWLIRAENIDAEVLCAAVCGYLLIGIFWTGIYSVVLLRDPGGLTSTDPTITKSDLLYFSYTTLTTTGFGDILPKNPVVRMLTVMEAIVGTFYNTIVIARFVGLYGLKPRPE
jgi:hypothetical protein